MRWRSIRTRPRAWPPRNATAISPNSIPNSAASGSRRSAAGVDDGEFRTDLDPELVYRFMRDTVWVAVRWYRPGGTMGVEDIAQNIFSIVLDGIAPR